MEFLIVTILACVVFAFCFAVFLLKDRREDGPPRLHRCGEGDGCHCYGKPHASQPTDLVQILGGTSKGCDQSTVGTPLCCASHGDKAPQS